MFKRGLAVLFLLASWFSAACAYELLPAHVAVVYNGKSELSRRMAREYARVRGVRKGTWFPWTPLGNEISRKELEDDRAPRCGRRRSSGGGCRPALPPPP